MTDVVVVPVNEHERRLVEAVLRDIGESKERLALLLQAVFANRGILDTLTFAGLSPAGLEFHRVLPANGRPGVAPAPGSPHIAAGEPPPSAERTP